MCMGIIIWIRREILMTASEEDVGHNKILFEIIFIFFLIRKNNFSIWLSIDIEYIFVYLFFF